MAFKKSTADVPPVIAADFAKTPRPSAVAEVDAKGYAKTKPMFKAQQKNSGQFGLPKSGGMKAMKMKGC